MRNAGANWLTGGPNGYLCFGAPGRGRLPVDVERHGDALVRGLVVAAPAAVKAAPFVPRRAPQRQVQIVFIVTAATAAARRCCTVNHRTVRDEQRLPVGCCKLRRDRDEPAGSSSSA